MKLVKRAEGSFHKYQFKWPRDIFTEIHGIGKAHMLHCGHSEAPPSRAWGIPGRCTVLVLANRYRVYLGIKTEDGEFSDSCYVLV